MSNAQNDTFLGNLQQCDMKNLIQKTYKTTKIL